MNIFIERIHLKNPEGKTGRYDTRKKKNGSMYYLGQETARRHIATASVWRLALRHTSHFPKQDLQTFSGNPV